jgi:pyruvate dehydrogenase E2 component (dihydrolipoamide acetyltransferase)
VTVNQIIVEIKTAKAVVELPCPYAGVVSGLLVSEGTTADVGTPIIAVDVGAEAGSGGGRAGGEPQARSPQATAAAAAEDLDPEPPEEGAVEPGIHGSPAPKQERQAVLVGYGVKLGPTTRRARKPRSGGAGSAPAGGAGSASAGPAPAGLANPPGATSPAASPAGTANPAGAARAGTANGSPARTAPAGSQVLAKPPVRKLAKDLGVDLARLAGTGPNGSITRDDVQTAAASRVADGQEAGPLAGSAPLRFSPAADDAREQRVAIRGVRKHTAAAVSSSAFTAPHVTEFLQVDVTATMAATAQVKTLPEFAGVRVSPLLFVARALLVAVTRHPMINSAWDESAQEIVVKNYVNLGIAAATDRGLVVPNIKDAHLLALPDLARALTELAETARAGRASVADMQGGTVTITNVGIFGIDAGTPILTPGEAAILAFGQVKDAPWVHEGQLAVRKVTTLSLSFDHRIVDGDLGSAVLHDVGAMLEDPVRILAWS